MTVLFLGEAPGRAEKGELEDMMMVWKQADRWRMSSHFAHPCSVDPGRRR